MIIQCKGPLPGFSVNKYFYLRFKFITNKFCRSPTFFKRIITINKVYTKFKIMTFLEFN